MACMALHHKSYIHQEELALDIDPLHNTYTYQDGSIERLAPGVEFGLSFDAHGPPAYPIGPLTKAVSFVKNRIRFFPDGSLQAGSVYFRDHNKTCLYACTISVAELPCIRTYTYNSSKCVWEKTL